MDYVITSRVGNKLFLEPAELDSSVASGPLSEHELIVRGCPIPADANVGRFIAITGSTGPVVSTGTAPEAPTEEK